MTNQQGVEQRASERHALALPITMEGEEGAVHDIGSQGVLFEVASSLPVGTPVTLSLHYSRRGVDCQLACDGEVVRVERLGDSYNIAVRLHKPLF